MDVIKKLNTMRLERNMSVYRLAELSGMSQSTIANYFSRKSIPSIANLAAMCEAMGMSLAQFFADGETSEFLAADELQLIRNYRRLPPEMKKAFTELADACPKNN